MSIAEFQHQIFEVAFSSPICDIPIVRRISPTAINLRVYLTLGGYIDNFYNNDKIIHLNPSTLLFECLEPMKRYQLNLHDPSRFRQKVLQTISTVEFF